MSSEWLANSCFTCQINFNLVKLTRRIRSDSFNRSEHPMMLSIITPFYQLLSRVSGSYISYLRPWSRDAQPIWSRHVLCPYMT